MSHKDAINPIICYGTGCCIECGGQLTVVDMETSFMELSPSGSPISEDTMIKCEGVCMHCGRRYPMMRDGLYYIHDNEYTRFIREYNNTIYNKTIQQNMDDLKPTKDNPFCIKIERQK